MEAHERRVGGPGEAPSRLAARACYGGAHGAAGRGTRGTEAPAAVEALEQPAPAAEDELDLASIGLAVFFVSLILVVGALLIVPAIF